VVSTGTVEIHPEHAVGTSKPLYWWLLTSRKWLPPLFPQRVHRGRLRWSVASFQVSALVANSLRATQNVLALKQRMPGLVILPAHDPTAARRLLES
jgi:hypothetical protein